jgi:CO/xanthine dehydrogenase Mo-binding subunit
MVSMAITIKVNGLERRVDVDGDTPLRHREQPGGMGEPDTCSVMPAMTNAIFAATGKLLRGLPVDPAQLRQT